jgi:hypothetical protein
VEADGAKALTIHWDYGGFLLMHARMTTPGSACLIEGDMI